MESFGPIACHYDELMSQVPYEMWVDYYLLLLEQLGQSPRTLLDVCCGTGTVAKVLAFKGFDVTGFDLSPDMIAQAKRKESERLAFLVADATSFEMSRKFDAAYSFFDSLNYIVEPDRFRRAVKAVARHIEPGGSFVFDLNTEYAFSQKMFDQHDKSKKSKVNYEWRGDYDPETRIIKVSMDFWADEKQFQETHVQRAHTHEEVVAACEDAGLLVVKVYDSYTLDPPRKRSDRLHYLTLKREG